jgi:hypothetical protein
MGGLRCKRFSSSLVSVSPPQRARRRPRFTSKISPGRRSATRSPTCIVPRPVSRRWTRSGPMPRLTEYQGFAGLLARSSCHRLRAWSGPPRLRHRHRGSSGASFPAAASVILSANRFRTPLRAYRRRFAARAGGWIPPVPLPSPAPAGCGGMITLLHEHASGCHDGEPGRDMRVHRRHAVCRYRYAIRTAPMPLFHKLAHVIVWQGRVVQAGGSNPFTNDIMNRNRIDVCDTMSDRQRIIRAVEHVWDCAGAPRSGRMGRRGAGSGAGVLDSNTDKSIAMDVEDCGVARWCPDVEDTYHRVLKDEVVPRLLIDRHRLCDPGSGLAGAA